MKLQKVAIIKKGIDIGRIIPFNKDESKYDFKISFAANDYEVNMYRFLSFVPEKVEIEDMTSWEISYHRSTALRPTIIHLKEKKNHPEYKPLPLHRLVDPTLHNEFPIPFMRIAISSDFSRKIYNSKSRKNILFDMEDANVAEFYLTHIDFNYERFARKWPTISLKLMVALFEFFATNNLLTDNNNKFKYFIPSDGGVRAVAEEFIVNNGMKFYINLYNNPELIGEKIKATFIENEFADALLGLPLIGYENEKGKVEMIPAYQEGLSRDTMSKEEKRKWEYRFNKMRDKLEREIRKVKRSSFIKSNEII
ncbi:hypothetical protein Thexy_1792 [Thermoanaerobacterium xylanolyticum LX-11]|uniref:Uncharacterized protein n=1 Tax=Thermoanaerobacterium xylanolyticum (strain ATCC 49914 / DSM 7097 / LX-11) TaxID=858215 RepID=F6BIT1_THEXL|nr:hypothetical protein [Thermoanaerobacterium xylanolyticum]AEF17816.1 hypothetical protein Thexy_1792 [Thermoanaerobacterium xylanolyticum LX-11]